jgi:hypothetical protein
MRVAMHGEDAAVSDAFLTNFLTSLDTQTVAQVVALRSYTLRLLSHDRDCCRRPSYCAMQSTLSHFFKLPCPEIRMDAFLVRTLWGHHAMLPSCNL